jgi:signal peptidase II
MTRKRNIMLSVSFFILLLIIDQLTKYYAVKYLKDTNGITIIPKVFRLYYLQNYGAAFGTLQNATAFFVILTTVCVVAMFYVMVRIPLAKRYLPMRVLIVLFLSGAVGNFIDRVSHQYVIDFLYFALIDFPIFNMADIYVTCSSIAFLLLFLFYYKEDDFSFLKRG